MSDEQGFSLRCGLALFQTYIEFLKNPEQKIKIAWNLKIKPILLKKFSIQKSGVFNINADVDFLIKEIDKMNTTQIKISDTDKTYIQSRLDYIRLNTIYISSKHNMKYNNKNKINNNNDNNNNSNKETLKKMNTSVNTFNNELDKNIKINDQNNINNPNDNNTSSNIKISNILKIGSSNNPFEKMRKELALNMKIMEKNKQEKHNIVLSLEKKFDIIDADRRRNKSKDEQRFRAIMLSKNVDPYKFLHELDCMNDNESNNKSPMLSIPEKNEKKSKEIISKDFIDEKETEDTMKYKNKQLKYISLDLILKNIVTSDFLKIFVNYAYYFSQQCFCFIPKEILFDKIINCYNFYKNLNLPFSHTKKLIYFLNMLIIEMYEYYGSIDNKELVQIKKIYNNLEDELNKKLGISTSNKNTSTSQINSHGDGGIKKKLSAKIEEKIKLMGTMVGRMKSDPIAKANTEKKTATTDKDTSKNKPENIQKSDENEMLNEIKQITKLLDYNEPDSKLIKDTKKNIYFYKLKDTLLDNKHKKKDKIIKNINLSPKNQFIKDDKLIKKYRSKYYFSILGWDTKDIGEALISISKKDLIKIQRRELYNAIFLKKAKYKTCPNIMECIANFNKLTSFIMEDILSYDFPKERAKVIEAWIKVAEYLKFRKDHNDCVAIYSALNHYIITGLKLTMKELKTKSKNSLKEISEFCTFEGNYKNLREDIINALNSNEYYLPYLGMLLRDMSFFEANSEYLINGNIINIEKIEKVQKAIDNFFTFKNIVDVYNKKSNYPPELNFFNNLELLKEDDLEILANKLEPKFMLGDYPQKEKRMTNLDKKNYVNKKEGNSLRKSKFQKNLID